MILMPSASFRAFVSGIYNINLGPQQNVKHRKPVIEFYTGKIFA